VPLPLSGGERAPLRCSREGPFSARRARDYGTSEPQSRRRPCGAHHDRRLLRSRLNNDPLPTLSLTGSLTGRGCQTPDSHFCRSRDKNQLASSLLDNL